MNKKVALLSAVVVLLLSGVGSYFYFSKNGVAMPSTHYVAPSANATNEPVDTDPKTQECPMNGALYSKKQEQKWQARRPLIIMVENHKEARPQSGLSNADVIHEAVAEGGITRFEALFYCQDAPRVGPVRSARVYFLTMAQGYGDHPLYGHVGGANCNKETGSGCANGAPADALGQISEMGWANYNDLSEFSVPFPIYHRDPDLLPGVATEHTVYTTTQGLWDFAAKKRNLTNVDEKGKAWDANWKPWKFKDDAKPADEGTTNKISFGFWTNLADDFSVVWTYDKNTNSYLRTTGGQPHLDNNTKKQLSTKNVVIVFSKESPANDGYQGGQHILYKLTGTGDGYVFNDGKSTKVTWKKPEETDMMRFYDENGKEVAFTRGQIFIEILPIGNKVDF